MTKIYPPQANKAAVAEWAHALCYVAEDVLILDTETTGLDNAYPIQIAITDIEGKPLFVTYLHTDHAIEDGAGEVHGITAEKIKDAPRFNEVYPILMRLLDQKLVVIYNAAFDVTVLELSCREYSLPPFTPRGYHCAMLNYAVHNGERRYGSYTWIGLEKACQKEKVIVTGRAHDALTDCQATALLISRLAEPVMLVKTLRPAEDAQ